MGHGPHRIHCTSFNKMLAPGMRVGWINGGRWHPRIAMLKFAQSRHNENCRKWCSPGFWKRTRRAACAAPARAAAHSARADGRGIAASFPDGTRFTPPCGGMFFGSNCRVKCVGGFFEAAIERRILYAGHGLFESGASSISFGSVAQVRPRSAPTKRRADSTSATRMAAMRSGPCGYHFVPRVGVREPDASSHALGADANDAALQRVPSTTDESDKRQ